MPQGDRQGTAGRAGPSVGAFVVNFNGGERTLRCLEALLRQSLPLSEILLVDNGSTDGSVSEVRRRFPTVRIVELGQNLGVSKARNAGLLSMKADLVLSLDSDMNVADDALEFLVETHLAHRPAAVCPRIVLAEEPSTVQCEGATIHFMGTLGLRHGLRQADGLTPEVSEVGGVTGACLLLDRERVIAGGGFDPCYFFYLEDLEFSYRMRALGYTLFCDARAVTEHDRGTGVPGLSYRGKGEYPSRRAYLSMRHRLLTMLIHYQARTLLLLLPALVIYEAAGFAVSLGRGWISEWFRAWGWQARNMREIARKRRFTARLRVRGDREILTGGPLPLAPGFIRSRPMKAAVTALSALLNSYWKIVRPLL